MGRGRDGPGSGLGGHRHDIGAGGLAAVRLRVLGPLAASRDGAPVELGAARQRAVLGLLALQPNAALRRDAMIDVIWGADPPASAVKMIHSYVSRLRHLLDPGRSQARDGLVVSTGTSYRLAAGSGQLDLIAFGHLADDARDARLSGDLALACDLYARALGLWRGEPLADIDLLIAHPAVIGLRQRQAVLIEEYAETAATARLHDRVLPHLWALAGRDPLNERAHAWLMIALSGSGQRAAALRLYDELRQRLDDQLGVRPGAELADAHARVLRQDFPASDVRDSPAAPPLPATESVLPRQLPPRPRWFTGREPELDEIRALAEGTAEATVICVIDGVAGVGKTALAVRAGHRLAARFPDGQLYVDLCGFGPRQPPAQPGEALTVFLRALGTDPHRIPAGQDEQAALYRSLLAGKRTLIVLDNAATAEQVRPLLPGAPGCLVLVTCRRRLSGLAARDGAARIALGPLAEADAMLLLRRALGRERVDAEPQAAAEIARRCGFLPLALRIAADRAAGGPPSRLAELAGQLVASRDRLDVLAADDDEATAVRTVLSWSYRALAPGAARAFRLLGLHAGADISVQAAAALTAVDEAAAQRLLEALAGMNLLDEARPGRYRFHDLLRAYAAELAAAEEGGAERATAIRRLLTWYLHTADNADRLLVPGRRHVSLAALEPDCEPLSFGDYEAALAWCDDEHASLVAAVRQAAQTGNDVIAWQLPVALRGYFDLRKPWADWIAAASTGLAAARRTGDGSGQAWALSCLAAPYYDLRRFEDALACDQDALKFRREIGDRRGEGATLNNLGCTYLELRRFEDALGCFQQVLANSREAGSQYGEGIALTNLGDTYQKLRLFGDALTCHNQALALFRGMGYRQNEGLVLNNLGGIYRMLRQPGEARERYEQALAVRQQADDRHGEAGTLRDLGDLLDDTGRPDEARQSWRQALAIFEDLADPQAAGIRDRMKRPRHAPADQHSWCN